MNSTYEPSDYMVDMMNDVADCMSAPACSIATAISNLKGIDPEVDLMVIVKALHRKAYLMGMTEATGALEDVFTSAYTHFVNNNFVDAEPDMYDDGDMWL